MIAHQHNTNINLRETSTSKYITKHDIYSLTDVGLKTLYKVCFQEKLFKRAAYIIVVRGGSTLGIVYARGYPMNPWLSVNETMFLFILGHLIVSAYPCESSENRCAYPCLFLTKANEEKEKKMNFGNLWKEKMVV
jgi:hypothetical protein